MKEIKFTSRIFVTDENYELIRKVCEEHLLSRTYSRWYNIHSLPRLLSMLGYDCRLEHVAPDCPDVLAVESWYGYDDEEQIARDIICMLSA